MRRCLLGRCLGFVAVCVCVAALGQELVKELPTVQEGKWKGYFAVYTHATFTACMDAKGVLWIQPLENEKEVGRRFSCYEVHCYYNKPTSDHIHSRPVIGFIDPPKEPIRQPDRIHLKGMLQENIPFEAEWVFQGNKITAAGGCRDHAAVEFPTRFRLISRFGRSHDITPQTEQEDREKILKDCFVLTREAVERRQRRSKHPYYDIMKFSGELLDAEIVGAYKPRVPRFEAVRASEGRLTGWIYRDNCPWQGFVIQYITHSKEINLRRNQAVMIMK